MKKERYFCFDSRMEFNEYAIFDYAFKAKDIKFVVKDLWNPSKIVGYRTSIFEFYNRDKEQIELNINGWRLLQINYLQKNSKSLKVELGIIDPKPNNETRYCPWFDDMHRRPLNDQDFCDDMFLIQYAYNFLEELSQYCGWKSVDLVKENNALKKEIENLKKQLHNENDH